jgi:hypothetical protein
MVGFRSKYSLDAQAGAMSFYPDTLPKDQLTVLRQVAPALTQMGFYLAGGTALALYLGHRQSVDLDWFSGEPLADPLRLAQRLRDAGLAFATAQTAPGTLHGHVLGVRMSLFEFRYPLLQDLVSWEDIGVRLASLDDLACMKLSAIAQRGSRKDFYDTYALCRSYRPLAQLLSLYRQKFAIDDIGPLLYGLVYFADAEAEPDPMLVQAVRWTAVKKAMRAWVREIAGSSPG